MSRNPFILAAFLAQVTSFQTRTAEIFIENHGFEQPGTVKIQNDWGLIPGWNADALPTDSGVETGWTTSGAWSGFLRNGDPAIWQLTTHVIAGGEQFTLEFLSRNNSSEGPGGEWIWGTLQAILYYDDAGDRIPFAVIGALQDTVAQEFRLDTFEPPPSAAIGKRLGVQFENITDTGSGSGPGTSWLLIDNVRLTKHPCFVAENQVFFITSVSQQTNGRIELAWESCPDHLYEIQVSEAIAQSDWKRCALMLGEDGTSVWTNTNAPTHAPKFFRVQRLSLGGDEDGDGLGNGEEFLGHGTDVRNPDTEGDGMPDGWEAQYALNPLNANDAYADLDGDGFSNRQEYQLRTRPDASYSHPADPPRGLLAWWKFDEGTGTNVFDSSRNGHHGAVLGSDPAGVWTAGYHSNGVTLGGLANSWIAVPYQPGLALTEEFALTGWVKPGAPGMLAGNFDSGGAGNYLLQFAPDAVTFRFSPAGDGSGAVIEFNPNWSTDAWHHLAVCSSGGTDISVFVDGEWRAGRSITGAINPVTNSILIGVPLLTNAFALDDVRLYGRALATNEIASLSIGNGLPLNMIVGQTATLRAFGASDGDTCQWSIVSGQGFFTNVANAITDFRPSWSGAVTVQLVYGSAGVLHTNFSVTTVTFPGLSPVADWNELHVQLLNNCYNFSTDIRTYTFAQPGVGGGSPGQYPPPDCQPQTGGAIADGLQAGVDINDLCRTSGLPDGHIIALLVWPGVDFHFVRMEGDSMWSSKAGNLAATTLDNSGQPIADPRVADFAPYQFCGFLWVGPDVHIR